MEVKIEELVAAARATRAAAIIVVLLLRAKHAIECSSDEEDYDSKDDEYSYFLSHKDIA